MRPHRSSSKTGIRANLGLVVLEFPTAWAKNADEYISKNKSLHEKYSPNATDNLITWAWAPHAPYTVSDATFERIRDLSEEMDTRVHLHLHETCAEVDESEKGNVASMSCHKSAEKTRPFKNLQRLGIINNRLIAAHMVHLTSEEQQSCADAGVSVVHCPCSNMKLARVVLPPSQTSRIKV